MKRLFSILMVCVLGLIVSAFLQKKVNVAGTWELTVESNVGNGKPTFVLKHVSDTDLEGTYRGQLGEADVKGKLEGNKIHLEFFVNDTQIEYDGAVEGNTMKGKVKLGNLGEGTFSGNLRKN